MEIPLRFRRLCIGSMKKGSPCRLQRRRNPFSGAVTRKSPSAVIPFAWRLWWASSAASTRWTPNFRGCMPWQEQRCNLTAYSILELIIHLAPYHAVRNVYTSLFYQLMWGYPIRNMRGNRETLSRYYLPRLTSLLDCLNKEDMEGFAAELKTVLSSDVEFSVKKLIDLGIAEASVIL